MKMKEVMVKTGLTEKTIRFYEERGLVKPDTQWRNGRTYHEFSEENVETLRAVVKLREAKFAIGEILSIQNDPSTLPDILETYQKRIRQEHDDLIQLQDFAESLPSKEIGSFQELYMALCHHSVRATAYVPELHFGRFDTETTEEKEQAIQRFSARKEPHISDWIIGILTLIAVASLAVNIVLLRNLGQVSPDTGALTEGWVYYRSGDALKRCLPDGTGSETIYQISNSHNEFNFLVTDTKIFLIDGTELYAIDADGRNRRRYDGSYAATSSSHYSSSWPALAYEDGMLFAVYSEAGQFGSGNDKLVELDVNTGKLSTLQTVSGEAALAVWNHQLYFYDIEDTEMQMQILDVGSGKQLFTSETQLTAEPVWFYQGTAYFSVDGANGSTLHQITTDTPDGEEIASCSGWYWGGYEDFFVYSESVAYVTRIGDADKTRVVLRDYVGLTPYGVVSANEDVVEITPYP